jgi:hypothetical protein
MHIRSVIIRMLAMGLALLLASCIDCREEYWLRADGGGRAALTYHLPLAATAIHGGESGLRKMVADFLGKTPEFSAAGCEVATIGDRVRVDIRVEFPSALALKKALGKDSLKGLPGPASALAGEIQAGLRGRTLEFSRRITASRALPGAAFMPGAAVDGHRLTYIMHLPAVAGDSNATRILDGGRTLVWDLPLADALRGPVETRFRMPVPVPWPWVAAIAAPLALVGILVAGRWWKPRLRFPIGKSAVRVL